MSKRYGSEDTWYTPSHLIRQYFTSLGFKFKISSTQNRTDICVSSVGWLGQKEDKL